MENCLFDIIIVGGAMTGSTLALALTKARPDLSIAVIEAADNDPNTHPGFDSRSIALSYGTMTLLKRFDLWSGIEDFATPIEQIHVSDQGHAGRTDIFAEQQDIEALGYVVELADMGRFYQSELRQSSQISLFCPDSVQSVERETEQVLITLTSGKTLQGKLLVAADGAESSCCRHLNHAAEVRGFEQSAIISTIQLSQPHHGQAFERFTPFGPVAMLPMSDNRMSLVWCVRSEDVDTLLALPESAFLMRLQQAFGWWLGPLLHVGKREAYPLNLVMRQRLTSHRFVVVGNAAQMLHPIAGQGFNLGIRDVVTLVEEVVYSADNIGDYRMRSRYQQRREADRQRTILMTVSFVHIFSNSWLLTALGRNLGLMALDSLPVLKRPLLSRALGQVSR